MSKYSIKELENLSGIKSHTIRIWEKRYNLLKPQRTDTNIRYYTDDDLRSLINVTSLMSHGFKISKIAEMSENDIYNILQSYIEDIKYSDGIAETLTNQMIIAALNYDEIAFEKAFSSAILRYGLFDTYLNVIYPLLEKIGLMWAKTDLIPPQEHFLSNLIKQKLQTAIDNIPPPSGANSPWVLFLPEEENHEIGLLFSSYLIRQKGYSVIYLGANVPIDNIYPILHKHPEAQLLFFLVKNFNTNKIIELLENTKKKFPSATINACSSHQFLESIITNVEFNKISSVELLLKMF